MMAIEGLAEVEGERATDGEVSAHSVILGFAFGVAMGRDRSRNTSFR